MDETPEITFGDSFGVFLFECAGGGVARVGKKLEILRFALFVNRLKRTVRHVDFAADFKHGRRIAIELKRDIAHGFGVGGDVITLLTIATG